MKVIAYVRVSTDEQAGSGLGIAAQRAAITDEAERRGWELIWIEDAGVSAGSLDRPGLAHAREMLAAGKADGLVVSKLDRLSRSMLDFATVMDEARKQKWSLITLDLGVDMTTPSGQLLANVFAAFAAFERELIRQRTRDALQAAKARGQRLGRPRLTPDDVVARVVALSANLSASQVAKALTAEGVPTTRGAAEWRPSTIRRLLKGHALDQESVDALASREKESA
ncbi:cassette chromosome recombinase B [Janibacter sp. HTCC2649]|uniref:recombinase family protein n=1 Tax=Janibacter sp. HTCC2649 TaxID=313589 RepID=UPI000066EBDA|nr:recombinase family protein [Janibacter sp. HTCC2649]EAP99442.1 cassette chromosome recombinase B [Janibacter sp. HTCC2649]